MGVFDFRADLDRRENCDHLRQLVRLMKVDEETAAERKLLEQIARRWGISGPGLKRIEKSLRQLA